MFAKYRNKRVGFSLIELIIVLAIIGILVAITSPEYPQMSKRGQDAAAQSALGNLKTAQEVYFLENDRYARTLDELKQWYTPEEAVAVAIITVDDSDLTKWAATARHKASTNVFRYDNTEGLGKNADNDG